MKSFLNRLFSLAINPLNSKSKIVRRVWSVYLMIFLILNLSILSTSFTLNFASSHPRSIRRLDRTTNKELLSSDYNNNGVSQPRRNYMQDEDNNFNLRMDNINKSNYKSEAEIKTKFMIPMKNNKQIKKGLSREHHIKLSVLGGLFVGLSSPSTFPQFASTNSVQQRIPEARASEPKSGKASDSLFNGSTSFGKKSMVESLSVILASKKILTPVQRYIEIGQYDPGRTNVNYCTKILRVRRALDNVVSQAQDNPSIDLDKLDAAIELTAVADNNFSQLDSSIYTLIFIPNEGNELPPNSRKYLVMAQDYYKTVMDSIDAALALGSPQELDQAQKLADKMEFPSFLFKEFKGDFYRAATP